MKHIFLTDLETRFLVDRRSLAYLFSKVPLILMSNLLKISRIFVQEIQYRTKRGQNLNYSYKHTFRNPIKPSLPITSDVASYAVFHFEQSTLVILDAKSQLNSIVRRNFQHICNSWLSGKNHDSSGCHFKHGEVQLVLNLDGAPIFKSRKLSVWPFWLQCHNLPPKLKSSYHNMTLLALWHGISKPKWHEVFLKLRFEMESLTCEIQNFLPNPFRYVFHLLVCDMPAKAAALNMMQFNGFNGCTHCLLIGERMGSRHIYPCNSRIILRTSENFNKHARKAQSKGEPVAGIKGISHLSSCFSFPLSAPIDAMHQVFLGTGKFLCKNFIRKIRPREIDLFNNELSQCLIPNDFLRKPRTTQELHFWKATDFKLLFLHLIPLVMQEISSVSAELKKSFWTLSLAIRLLSLKIVEKEDINEASRLIDSFFDTFKELYGEEKQSYNFHSMRHLCEQVDRIGPLYTCSAFAFESANHSLLRTLSGTIKRPERIVEVFLRNQKLSLDNSGSQILGEASQDTMQTFTTLTKMSELCQRFCFSLEEYNTFMGRWKNQEGLVFNSMSYCRLNENFANAVVCTKDKDFHRIEVFASSHGKTVAVVRQFLSAVSISSYHVETLRGSQLFHLGGLSELKTICVSEICGKCVLKPNLDGTFSASIVSEGFEHN